VQIRFENIWYSGNKMKKEKGGACSMYEGEERVASGFGGKT